ncbi:hypothetical protein [Pseudorhodobacter sp.]|uniref:hypothetical protein n=1 Tax=Pseudorhodobacter sp. TaxID=1934400 RepID=UPI002648A513|nr:hypothetical protein [Pseudorhodobacter sp.]MDN5787806.1 hypothetical protein [Pseudorhodobacter sp.]
MSVAETLADGLAKATLDAMEFIDDDRFYEKVSRVIGGSSPTLQEAFMTSIRVRLAERRGQEFVAKALAAAKSGAAAPDAPKDMSVDGH